MKCVSSFYRRGGMQMEQDAGWGIFLSDDRRYADFINGCVYGGRQVVKEEHIQETDTKITLRERVSGRKRYFVKFRDIVRKVICGVNFAVIGVESQETKDYAYPIRNMIYDAGEYEKQLRKIRKAVRTKKGSLSPGEYLYGFRKEDRIKPAVTFLLYAGKEPWEKPEDLWDMLDFTDIPDSLREKVQNYRINLIDIRRLQDTSVFQTDIREVFDFIRCSENKNELKELVENNRYFRHMEEDAFDVATGYASASELKMAKEKYLEQGGINMCTAIQEMMADSRAEGFNLGISQGISQGINQGKRQIIRNMLARGMSDEDIMALAECAQEEVDKVRQGRENILSNQIL
jgi:hypothetical protein